jgi:predicted Zn-dependent protease
MSTITLIPSENKLYVDGSPLIMDDLGLDDNIWAIQWDGSKGETEYNDGTPNEAITEFDEAGWVAKYEQKLLDIQADIAAEEKKVVDAMTYKQKRLVEYDKLEQFEMMYDDKINETTTWVDAIQAIKKSYPK